MGWSSLGTVSLTYDWQFLIWSSSVEGIFRLGQTWETRPIGKGLIAQVYGDVSSYQFFGIHGFYPNKELKILEIPVPQAFISSGNLPTYLGLKLASRTRVFDFNWKIHVETFDPN